MMKLKSRAAEYSRQCQFLFWLSLVAWQMIFITSHGSVGLLLDQLRPILGVSSVISTVFYWSNNHGAHSDSREWRKRFHFLMRKWQGPTGRFSWTLLENIMALIFDAHWPTIQMLAPATLCFRASLGPRVCSASCGSNEKLTSNQCLTRTGYYDSLLS